MFQLSCEENNLLKLGAVHFWLPMSRESRFQQQDGDGAFSIDFSRVEPLRRFWNCGAQRGIFSGVQHIKSAQIFVIGRPTTPIKHVGDKRLPFPTP